MLWLVAACEVHPGIICNSYLERQKLMPLVQGGPPEWIWERTPDKVRWELILGSNGEQNAKYELRVQCGLEIMRIQFFGAEEISELASALVNGLKGTDALTSWSGDKSGA